MVFTDGSNNTRSYRQKGYTGISLKVEIEVEGDEARSKIRLIEEVVDKMFVEVDGIVAQIIEREESDIETKYRKFFDRS